MKKTINDVVNLLNNYNDKINRTELFLTLQEIKIYALNIQFMESRKKQLCELAGLSIGALLSLKLSIHPPLKHASLGVCCAYAAGYLYNSLYKQIDFDYADICKLIQEALEDGHEATNIIEDINIIKMALRLSIENINKTSFQFNDLILLLIKVLILTAHEDTSHKNQSTDFKRYKLRNIFCNELSGYLLSHYQKKPLIGPKRAEDTIKSTLERTLLFRRSLL